MKTLLNICAILLLISQNSLGQKPEGEQGNANGVSLLLELAPLKKTNEYTLFHVHIINTSNDTIFYQGYKRQPWWRQQVINDDSTWEEVNVGWFCGVGLGTRKVLPGKKVMFSVSGVSPSRNIRIGLDYKIGDMDYTVWTEQFTFIKEE